jgi:hypothetical protein
MISDMRKPVESKQCAHGTLVNCFISGPPLPRYFSAVCNDCGAELECTVTKITIEKNQC